MGATLGLLTDVWHTKARATSLARAPTPSSSFCDTANRASQSRAIQCLRYEYFKKLCAMDTVTQHGNSARLGLLASCFNRVSTLVEEVVTRLVSCSISG